jgi:GntR family transcriptional regulator
MAHGLSIDPADAVPIWRQIEHGVRRLVASGTLRAGTAAPSVRELAQDLGVNPATVSKAYQRLIDAGLLEVRRGEGTFVAASRPVAREERERALHEGASRFVALATALGTSRGEALAEVREAWAEAEAEAGKGGKR